MKIKLTANYAPRRGESGNCRTDIRIFAFFIVFFSLFIGQTAKAVKCEDFSALGYSCAAKTECKDDGDVVSQTQNLIESNNELKASNKDQKSAVIVGTSCDAEKKVCCMPKKTDSSNKPAAGATAAPTSDCDAQCQSIKAYIEANYQPPKNKDGSKFEGFLPDCAYSGTCREANDLVQLFINQGKSIFGIIGMIALTAFVYGGFLMVFSFGSADKVKQGRDVMIAAVVGIIIVFSAYLIVAFILSALGVSDEFKAIK